MEASRTTHPPPGQPPELASARQARWLAAFLGWYAFLGGLLSFMGWVTGVKRLAAWGSDIAIQPNAALAATAAGAALVVFAFGRRRLVVPFAALCGLIGLATLFEHLATVNLGIDGLFTFGRPWDRGTVAPGRMGPPASTSWSLLGLGLLAALGGSRAQRVAPVLGLAAVTIGALSLVGYLLGADPLFAVARFTAIALQTATMIVAVGLGLVAGLPNRQPMRTLLEPTGAGLLARRALPFVIVVPVVVGLLTVHGREVGWFDRGLGTAVMVLALMIAMSLVLWWCIGAVSAHERALAAATWTVRQNEARFRRLADAMPQIVYVLDADGGITFINQQWSAYTGRAAGAPDDTTFAVHPDDLPGLLDGWDRARKAGLEFAAEFRLRGAADGRYRWHLSRVVPIRDQAGRVVQWYGTSTDIHEQKEAEATLRESERRFRDFADAAPAMLWEAGPDGACTFRSRGWSEFSGQSETEALGFGWLEAVHPDERETVRGGLLAAAARGEPFTLEHRVRRSDGEYRWVISAGRPRVSPEGEFAGYSASVIDIHDRKQAEEQLRQAAKMEAIGRLAGGVAHDFNNQLNAVGGFASFAARDPGIGARARHDLEEVLKAVDRMAGLTRQLLAFSRQQVLQPETLQLNAAVLDGSALLQRLLGSHIEMSLDLTADPTWIRVDRAQLLQVLMNLAINARDAMPDGGRLRIRTGTVKGHVRLSVGDTGAGIPAEHLPHIFEPFFTTKGPGQGTGLGLATVHGIVAQSEGHISVESRPGEGAEFTVLFPAVAMPAGVETAPAGPPAGPPRPARLLVVDDEEAVRGIVSRTLEAEGYEVSQACDGREALERLARNGRVDAVLTDVVMPHLGGRELVERLAEEYPGLPVIWMSGYPRDAAFADGGAGRTNAFLQKPIPPDVLVRTVKGVLGARVTASTGT